MMHQRLAGALGVLGIAPFALALAWPDAEAGMRAFSLYSLAIFSFLCGNWWSVALVARGVSVNERILILLVSNLMVLLSLALVFSSHPLGLPCLALLYTAIAVGEWVLPAFSRQPGYYRSMRTGVSAVVVVLHGVGWVLAISN